MHYGDLLHQCISAHLLLYKIGIYLGEGFCSFLLGELDFLFLRSVSIRFEGENIPDLSRRLKRSCVLTELAVRKGGNSLELTHVLHNPPALIVVDDMGNRKCLVLYGTMDG